MSIGAAKRNLLRLLFAKIGLRIERKKKKNSAPLFALIVIIILPVGDFPLSFSLFTSSSSSENVVKLSFDQL